VSLCSTGLIGSFAFQRRVLDVEGFVHLPNAAGLAGAAEPVGDNIGPENFK
jgi:hypothetical protein